MEQFTNGDWDVSLQGICYREMALLGQLLYDLGHNGSINNVDFDLDTLHAHFNARTGEVNLYDLLGNTTEGRS